jgi:hypothetical protein
MYAAVKCKVKNANDVMTWVLFEFPAKAAPFLSKGPTASR